MNSFLEIVLSDSPRRSYVEPEFSRREIESGRVKTETLDLEFESFVSQTIIIPFGTGIDILDAVTGVLIGQKMQRSRARKFAIRAICGRCVFVPRVRSWNYRDVSLSMRVVK